MAGVATPKVFMRVATHVMNGLHPKHSLLQHTASHCNTLQRTATHCNTLQLTSTHCEVATHVMSGLHLKHSLFKSRYTCHLRVATHAIDGRLHM